MGTFIPSKEIAKYLLEEEIGEVSSKEFEMAYEMSVMDVVANNTHGNFMNVLSWSIDLLRREKIIA